MKLYLKYLGHDQWLANTSDRSVVNYQFMAKGKEFAIESMIYRFKGMGLNVTGIEVQ